MRDAAADHLKGPLTLALLVLVVTRAPDEGM